MKRLRKLAKIAFISAIVLAGCVTFLVWRDSAKRNAAISSIREAGDPVSIAELRPDEVAPSENAATHLMPILDDLEKLVSEIYPIALAEEFDWKSGLTGDQQEKSEAILATHAKVNEALQLASRCEATNWPLDYNNTPSDFTEELLDKTSLARNVARFHIAKARTLAANRNADAATDVCVQGLRIVRLQNDTPTLVASMVNTACRNSLLSELSGLLQHHKLTPATHQAIEAELIQHDTLDTFIQTLKSEQAFGISSFDEFPSVPGLGVFAAQFANYIDYMDEQIAFSSHLPFEQTQVESVQPSGLTNLIAPAVKSGREAYFRSIAHLRSVRVLSAILSLEPAPPSPNVDGLGLPAEATVDPYSGNPLIIKKTDAGWTVYSVGPNVTDDGGQITSDATASLDVGV
jgi:hypothetical protein